MHCTICSILDFLMACTRFVYVQERRDGFIAREMQGLCTIASDISTIYTK
jgi:hypothetical protein